MASNDIEYLTRTYPEYVEKVKKHYLFNFFVISLDSAFFTFSMAMLSQDTILPYFMSKLTSSALLIGLIPALFFLGQYFPQLIGAYLVSGKNRKKYFILWAAIAERVGILLIALTAQFMGLLTNQVTILLFFISYALFTSTLGLMMPAYSDFISKAIMKNRGLFYGVMVGLGGGIGFIASSIASRLIDRLGFPLNFQTIFWLGFGFSFISPFLIAMFKEVDLPVVEAKEKFSTFVRTIPIKIASHPLYKRFLVIRGLVGLGMMGNSFFSIYAITQYDLRSGTIGIFTMFILISQSLMGFVWGWLGDHFGYKKVLQGMMLFLIVEGTLALINPGLWAFYLIAALVGGVYAGATVCDPNIIFEMAPPSETSRYVGITNTLLGPIFSLAPIIGGLLVDQFTHTALFATIAALEIVTFILAVFWFPEPRGHDVHKPFYQQVQK